MKEDTDDVNERVRVGGVWLHFKGTCGEGLWHLGVLTVSRKTGRWWDFMRGQNPVPPADLIALRDALDRVIPKVQARRQECDEDYAEAIDRARASGMSPG